MYFFFFKLYWSDGAVQVKLPSLDEVRNRVQSSLQTLRQDHKRNLNPTPYKVLEVALIFFMLIIFHDII